MNPTDPHARLTRRETLSRIACGFGGMAFSGMLTTEALGSPLSLRKPHFPAQAKRVIFLFLHGGVSHVDSFDPKPELARRHGQPLPIPKPDFEFADTGNLLQSPWNFSRYGECGTQVSELFPKIGECMDEIALVRSMTNGKQVSHGPAALSLHTGDGVFMRPSLGAWTLYGLGVENRNLPGFIALSPSSYHGGAQNFGSAFLPAAYQGMRIGDGHTSFKDAKIPNLSPASPEARQRRLLNYLKIQNQRHLDRKTADGRLEARLQSFELAFRMQMAAPRVFDLENETKPTRELYGVGDKHTDEFGRQCLLARRLAEAGVRFIQVNHSYPRNYWDAHGGLKGNHSSNAIKVDQPIAGLLRDLKGRGMLDETLVVFGTEFGRTPAAQGGDGRDHHPHAFSMWLAGGGIRGGLVHGETDEFGYYVVRDEVNVHDLHATILHLLGLDHERLTYNYAGRNFRLTDVSGKVVRKILS